MIKSGIQPVIRIVAHLAVRRVCLGLMILSVVILHLVAGDAIRFCIEHRSLVTIRTLYNHGMTSRQGKSGGGMIESRWFPGCRIVARLTDSRNAGGGMSRCLCLVEFRLVAGIAIRGSSGEPLGMTTGTISCHMSSGKWKIRVGVIKSSFPGSPGMTGEAGNAVILISIDLIMAIIHTRFIMGMAISTGKNSVIISLFMTFYTIDTGMPSGIHREITAVMFRISGWCPFRAVGMAI